MVFVFAKMLLTSTFRSYTLMLLLISLMLTSVQVEAFVVCPPSAAYTPCSCSESSSVTNYISLNCNNWGLDDSRMSEILTSFLTTSGVSPVTSLYLNYNYKLTYVPREIKFFTQATGVELYNNVIS
jgi:hypothetical protein